MFNVRKVEDAAIISLDSSIEKGSKEDTDCLKTLVANLTNEGIRGIVLNMQQVENAPSIVLGTIIILQKRLSSSNNRIVILNPTDRMMKIFHITKLDSIIGIYETEEDALSALGVKSAVRTN